MTAGSRADARPPLVRVFAECGALLARESPAGVSPLLRLQHGAGLVQASRVEAVTRLVLPLLATAAPRLYVSKRAATIRPKLRLSLSLGGAGLIAELRYFGDAPTDARLRAVFAPLAPRVLALPLVSRADARNGEVCLRAVWLTPAQRWSLVQVLAGRREVALPMSSVERVLAEDGQALPVEERVSLAHCLGEEPIAAAQGRPAVLVLRRRGPPLAVRVEALLGHGEEQVLPVGPLLQGAPWLLGVVARDEHAPLLVLDPLGLPGVEQVRAV